MIGLEHSLMVAATLWVVSTFGLLLTRKTAFRSLIVVEPRDGKTGAGL